MKWLITICLPLLFTSCNQDDGVIDENPPEVIEFNLKVYRYNAWVQFIVADDEDGVIGEVYLDDQLVHDFSMQNNTEKTIDLTLGDLDEQTEYQIKVGLKGKNGVETSFEQIFVTDDDTYKGDLEFTKKEEIEFFDANQYVKIVGDVYLENLFEAISEPRLNSVEEVIGNVTFQELKPIGSEGNVFANLRNIDGSLRFILIDASTLDQQFANLIEVTGIKIQNSSLSGVFRGLEFIRGSMYVKSGEAYGFGCLKEIGNLEIVDSGYSNLDFLSTLERISNVKIHGNYGISDYCGLRPVLCNGGLTGSYEVYANSVCCSFVWNPTMTQIINGNCTP